jgi:archaellum component FlaC
VNKNKINGLTNAVERIKTLELDLEPEGRITEAFTALENHIDEKFAQMDSKFDLIDSKFNQIDSRLDRMEHQFNRLQSKLEVVLDFITGIDDLPEDET